jgi:hypothetical protein
MLRTAGRTAAWHQEHARARSPDRGCFRLGGRSRWHRGHLRLSGRACLLLVGVQLPGAELRRPRRRTGRHIARSGKAPSLINRRIDIPRITLEPCNTRPHNSSSRPQTLASRTSLASPPDRPVDRVSPTLTPSVKQIRPDISSRGRGRRTLALSSAWSASERPPERGPGVSPIAGKPQRRSKDLQMQAFAYPISSVWARS